MLTKYPSHSLPHIIHQALSRENQQSRNVIHSYITVIISIRDITYCNTCYISVYLVVLHMAIADCDLFEKARNLWCMSIQWYCAKKKQFLSYICKVVWEKHFFKIILCRYIIAWVYYLNFFTQNSRFRILYLYFFLMMPIQRKKSV